MCTHVHARVFSYAFVRMHARVYVHMCACVISFTPCSAHRPDFQAWFGPRPMPLSSLPHPRASCSLQGVHGVERAQQRFKHEDISGGRDRWTQKGPEELVGHQLRCPSDRLGKLPSISILGAGVSAVVPSPDLRVTRANAATWRHIGDSAGGRAADAVPAVTGKSAVGFAQWRQQHLLGKLTSHVNLHVCGFRV